MISWLTTRVVLLIATRWQDLGIWRKTPRISARLLLDTLLVSWSKRSKLAVWKSSVERLRTKSGNISISVGPEVSRTNYVCKHCLPNCSSMCFWRIHTCIHGFLNHTDHTVTLREWGRLTWETSHHTVSRQIYVIYVFNRIHRVSCSIFMQYVRMSLPSGGFCIALYMSTVCTWLSLAAAPATKEMLGARAQIKFETLERNRYPLCTKVYRRTE